MPIRSLTLIVALAALTACGQTGLSRDAERAAVGAGIGAGIAAATDENILAGAAIGGAAGALADDVGIAN